MQLAKKRGAKLAIRLNVSGAFHSPLMEHAATGLEPHIERAKIRSPEIPVIGNTKAQVLSSVENVRIELSNQISCCVQWEDTVRYLLSQRVNRFVEIGPGDVLAGLVKRISTDAITISIGNNDDIKAMTS